MYSCEAEHSHEISFPQGAHFSNGEQHGKVWANSFSEPKSSHTPTYGTLFSSSPLPLEEMTWPSTSAGRSQ